MNARRSAHTLPAGGAGDRPLEWPGDPESLTPEAVDFEALGHVLANTCRRGGRLRRFHSVAAHAVTMSEAIEDLGRPVGRAVREAALHALLIEASVAWLGPDAAPSRRKTERMRRLGVKVDRAVREAAGLGSDPTPEAAELLRFIARMAEAAEARDLPGASEDVSGDVAFPPLDRRIRPLEPARAARLWLERFHDLRGPQEDREPVKENAAAQEKPHDANEQATTEAQLGSPLAGGSRDAA